MGGGGGGGSRCTGVEFRENDPIKRILSKRIIVARFEMNPPRPGHGDSTIGSKVENLEKSSIAGRWGRKWAEGRGGYQ